MKESKRNYVVCIRAEESFDIEVRKIYEVLPDEVAAKRGYARVVDESGEDYLYPEEYFVPVHPKLPRRPSCAPQTSLLRNNYVQR